MPLKGILIVGVDGRGNHATNIFTNYQNNPDWVIIDYSQKVASLRDFISKLREYEIGPNTRIDIWGHGNNNVKADGESEHNIALLREVKSTREILQNISNVSGSVPLQVHIWSCFAGSAARAVRDLPNGSVVLAHGPETSITYINTNKEGIKTATDYTIAHDQHRMNQVAQDLVDNLPSYILQDLNIGIKGLDGRVHTSLIAESSNELSALISDKEIMSDYYLGIKQSQIQSYIREMVSSQVLSSEIEIPQFVDYSDEVIKNYSFNRLAYNLFMRKDSLKPDFIKLIKNYQLISQEIAERTLDTYSVEMALMSGDFQKILLGQIDSKGNNFLHTNVNLFYNDPVTQLGGIIYLVNVAVKNNVLEEYLQHKNQNGDTALDIALLDRRIFAGSNKNPLHINMIRHLLELQGGVAGKDLDGKTCFDRLLDKASREEPMSDRLKEAIKFLTLEAIKTIDGQELIIEQLSKSITQKNYIFATLLIEKTLEQDFSKLPHFYVATIVNIAVASGNKNLISKFEMQDIRLDQNHLLQIAIIKNDINKINAMLRSGEIDLNQKNHFEKTPLDVAFEAGNIMAVKAINAAGGRFSDKNSNDIYRQISVANVETVKNWVNSGIDINKLNDKNMSLLDVANGFGNLEVVKLLLQHGAKLTNHPINQGITEMHLAARFGSSEKLAEIIGADSRLDINSKTAFGKSPLDYAIDAKNSDTIKYLLTKGANSSQKQALLDISFGGEDLELINLSLNIMGDINNIKLNGSPILFEAIMKNNPDLVQLLLDKGATVNCISADRNKLVDVAISGGSIEIVKNLLDKDRSMINDGISLKTAINSHSVEMVETLISYGVDVNREDINGFTPLSKLLQNDYIDYNMVKSLCKNGADLFKKSRDQESPFDLLILRGDVDLLSELTRNSDQEKIKKYINENISFIQSKCCESSNSKMLNYLVEKGFIEDNETKMIISIMEGNIEKSREIISKGVDLNYCVEFEGNGSFLFEIAVKSKNLEAVKLLKENGVDLTVINYFPVAHGPIEESLRYGNFEMARYLFNSGVDPKRSWDQFYLDPYEDNRIRKFLPDVASFCDEKMVKEMLNNNASLDTEAGNQRLLDIALSYGNMDGAIAIAANGGTSVTGQDLLTIAHERRIPELLAKLAPKTSVSQENISVGASAGKIDSSEATISIVDRMRTMQTDSSSIRVGPTSPVSRQISEVSKGK